MIMCHYISHKGNSLFGLCPLKENCCHRNKFCEVFSGFCLAVPIDETPACEPSVPEATRTPQRSVSPVASNMMSSIQLKKEEEDEKSRKRRRSLSVEGPGVGQLPSPTLPPSKVMQIKETFW